MSERPEQQPDEPSNNDFPEGETMNDETQPITPDGPEHTDQIHQPDQTDVLPDEADRTTQAPPAAASVASEPGATWEATIDEQPTGGRHPVNIGHLVMGIAFAGLFVIWALIQSSAVEGADIRWLLPVPWLAAGAIGLIAVTRSRRTSY